MDIITQIFGILFWFVVILVPLVAIHEFGHLLISRMFNVKIPEYAIGLPLVKRTFFFRWKGITWSFYWPLLGGFVRIYGDNDALDEAYEINKTNPKQAREDYIQNRFQEILATRDLQFFLEENSLDYDKKWKKFEQSKFAKGLEVEEEKEYKKEFEKKYNQISTLIEWEFDQKLESKDTFFNKNWIQQALIISGGVLFNMVTAVILFWLVFAVFSFNTSTPIDDFADLQKNANLSNVSNYFSPAFVSKDSKASEIGLKPGGKIFNFGGVEATKIESTDQFKKIVQENKGKETTIDFESKETGQRETKTVTLENKPEEILFGVSTLVKKVNIRAKGPIAGLNMGIQSTSSFTRQTFSILGSIGKALLPGQDKAALNSVGGPIAVGAVGSSVFSASGVSGILYVMALVSISLAVFNTLPIPALDGGRLLILTINKITGKRNRKLEGSIIGITFLLLIGLAILIALKDLQGVSTGAFKF